MKEYENISDLDQLGYAPGEVFEADIPEAQEARLVERGAIRVTGESDTVTGDDGEGEGDAQVRENFLQSVGEGDDDNDTNNTGDAGEGNGYS